MWDICSNQTMPPDNQTTFTDYLVLGTWEAINLLAEARERCEAADVSELLTKAETILISVVSELPALARGAGAVNRHNGLAAGEPAQTPFDHRPTTRALRDPS
jgi:hypothetical protein